MLLGSGELIPLKVLFPTLLGENTFTHPTYNYFTLRYPLSKNYVVDVDAFLGFVFFGGFLAWQRDRKIDNNNNHKNNEINFVNILTIDRPSDSIRPGARVEDFIKICQLHH